MRAKHRRGVDDTETVRAAERLCQTGRSFISLRPRPVALKFQQGLHGRHRAGASLYHAVNGPLVRLVGNVSARVGDHVDLKTLVERRQSGPDDAHRGPKTGKDDPSLADAVDLLDHRLV